MNWYQIGVKEIFEKLGTSENGLNEEEVRQRLLQYGPNKLAEEEKISRLKILLHQFTSPLIYILLIAGVVTIFLQEYIDSGVIFAVVILNAIIGYFQEYKAEESVRALRRMVVPKAKVIRDGREKEIRSEELVPGDIVLLASGTRVPADLRIIHAIELKTDESLLTGESLPVEKTYHALKEENLIPGDQKNMAFMGTVVVNGRAKGIVVETAAKTVLGSIAREVKEIGTVKAPLQEKIHGFAKAIGFIVLGASVALFFIGILIGESVKDMFMTAVAAAVATIPEGLPIVVTIAMAVGVARMAKQNAIIRKLPAVETLGSTMVIGSDKTGTLTKNEMTVKLIYDGKHIFEVTGSGHEPKGEILHEGLPIKLKERKHLAHVLRIGLLCNESNIYEEEGQYKVDGDPTEGALIVSAMKAGLHTEEEKEKYQQIAIIPFESDRGYMATLHKHRGKKVIFVKGGPEKVLDMCVKNMDGEELDKKEIHHIASEFAKEGLRILAFAYREARDELEELTCKDVECRDVESGLVFAGLQGMMDPPRPEAIQAIEGCKKAGIRVIMITGDHTITARAIAKMLGIADDSSEVLTGKELEEMDDEKLFEKVKRVSVFARVSHLHKLRIVQQVKKYGDIVAVTGDGVNDAPALKAAHIGVAMGKSGTDVAKEASDMVLTDDNFASIFNAVKEGRIVFDNIRKVTFFLIPTGIAAILSIVGTIILGAPIPYVPAQLLWINLVTNGLQDVALAFEPGEKGIIDRPPRGPEEGIMSRLLIERTILVGLLISAGVVYNFMTALNEGASLEKARTVAVTTMVFFQFFQAWNSRSELESIFKISPLSNPFLFYSMIAAFLAQLSVIYVPALQWVFRTEPITTDEWLRILIVSVTVIIVVETDKWARRKRYNRRTV
jgi:Ca2+-transporting ATPase